MNNYWTDIKAELQDPIFENNSDFDNFDLFHIGMQKTRSMPRLIDYIYLKISQYFYHRVKDLITDTSSQESTEVLYAIVDIKIDCSKIISLVKQAINDLPLLTSALDGVNDFLKYRVFKEGVWFSGRDGLPMLLALKAKYWGFPLGERGKFKKVLQAQISSNPRLRQDLLDLAIEARVRMGDAMVDENTLLGEGISLYYGIGARFTDFVKYAFISRILLENVSSFDGEDILKEYLVRLGITKEMFAVDTGFTGSVIRKAMEILFKEPKLSKIALVSKRSADSRIAAIMPKQDDVDHAIVIETLPKRKERAFDITTENANRIQIHAVDMPDIYRISSEIVEHMLIHVYAPRAGASGDPMEMAVKNIEIDLALESDEEVDYRLLDQYKSEIINLFAVSREFVARPIILFAHHLLTSLSEKAKNGQSNAKLLFLGRDGLGSFEAAKELLRTNGDRYPNINVDMLIYAQINRKIISDESSIDLIPQYLNQLGVSQNDSLTIIDIGMYGTIIDPLKNALQSYCNVEGVEFFISRTSRVPGFFDDVSNKRSSIKNISGNPAIHFLEDTFSGPIKSPDILRVVNINGEDKVLPLYNDIGINASDQDQRHYQLVDFLKRKYALQAVLADIPFFDFDNDVESSLQKLDSFLANPDNYKDIMIAHE